MNMWIYNSSLSGLVTSVYFVDHMISRALQEAYWCSSFCVTLVFEVSCFRWPCPNFEATNLQN